MKNMKLSVYDSEEFIKIYNKFDNNLNDFIYCDFRSDFHVLNNIWLSYLSILNKHHHVVMMVF